MSPLVRLRKAAAFHRERPGRLIIPAAAVLLALKLLQFGPVTPVRSSHVTMLSDARAAPAPEPGHASAPAAEPRPADPQAADSRAADSQAAIEPSAPPEPTVSLAERQLLQDLRNRRTELDAREQRLQQRETVMDATEHRLTARILEMANLQARLEQLEAARRAHDEANWAGLVKLYETMKPRDAAAIFNDMDMKVLLQVIDRMKDTKAAPVLAAMQPDRARQLTGQLAAMRTRSTTVPEPAG